MPPDSTHIQKRHVHIEKRRVHIEKRHVHESENALLHVEDTCTYCEKRRFTCKYKRRFSIHIDNRPTLIETTFVTNGSISRKLWEIKILILKKIFMFCRERGEGIWEHLERKVSNARQVDLSGGALPPSRQRNFGPFCLGICYTKHDRYCSIIFFTKISGT